MSEPGLLRPLELRPPEAGRVLPLLFLGFFGLILLVMGLAALQPLIAVPGVVLLLSAFGLQWYQKRCLIRVESDRLTVITPFSEQVCLFQQADLLRLRRSWTRTRRRWTQGGGLLDVAARFEKNGRVLATVPVSWSGSAAFREAMTFFETLPIRKVWL